MDVAAENATSLPKLGRPRMKLRVQASQTANNQNAVRGVKLGTLIPVRMGDLHFLSTWANHLPPGIPPEE